MQTERRPRQAVCLFSGAGKLPGPIPQGQKNKLRVDRSLLIIVPKGDKSKACGFQRVRVYGGHLCRRQKHRPSDRRDPKSTNIT